MEILSIAIAIIIGACIGVFVFYLGGGFEPAPPRPNKGNKMSNSSSVNDTQQQQQQATGTAAVSSASSAASAATATSAPQRPPDVLILYASQKGHAKETALQLEQTLRTKLNPFRVEAQSIDTVDSVEDLKRVRRILFVVATYEGGTPPNSAKGFAADLLDLVNDFRVERDLFYPMRFAVFGLGDASYASANFCKFAKDLTFHFCTLGAERYISTMCADEPHVAEAIVTFAHKVASAISRDTTVEQDKAQKRDFIDQKRVDDAEVDKNKKIAAVMKQRAEQEGGGGGGGCCGGGEGGGAAQTSSSCGCKAADIGGEQEGCNEAADKKEKKTKKNADGEDVAASSSSSDGDGGEDECSDSEGDIEEIVSAPRKHLLYPRLRRSLEKQGYALIGTHSAVKLCRWTKSALRGRGFCYKDACFGILSHRCMEFTPSVACASKCVFCWRHHTNPTARSFQWEHDPPEFLIDAGIHRHQQMVKMMRGVPGVIPQRMEEAMNVRHCALSLVGEPIMYPELNKFLKLCHERRISTFLVTNAQFPDQMETLTPCTQLYLSIDASTPEDLKKIDRPVHEDYWERFMRCIKLLARVPQRTVFRLTLVHEYNTRHLKEYADLVREGQPQFVEVKAFTFCGTSDASELTIKHAPFHSEVVQFCKDLVAFLPGYEIACEHEHSCMILIARTHFKINGKWHTWIDYDKFYELVDSGRTDFSALEYCTQTPDWAVFGSSEHGFAPTETRHKKGKPITGGGC